MKPTKTLPKLTPPWLSTLLQNETHLKALTYLAVFICLAAVIWLAGPYITWKDYVPLAQPEKRFYVILFLFLIWLLKLLMIDMDASIRIKYQDSQSRKKMHPLHSHFRGAIQFLNKTIISKQGKQIRLIQLPWYLLIGPHNAGKTSLLANSSVSFILQRQFQQNLQQLTASENCNWWVTREASIIDVPGKYLSALDPIKNRDDKTGLHPILWRYFLRLIKKQRGKAGIDGIVLALPLPEIMLQGDTKKYHGMLRNLFQRLEELQNEFPHPIPCHLMITKCDLLPGFSSFFSELGANETDQTWGVMLPRPKQPDKLQDIFAQRFNILIKKLNDQLLWRLHNERNPQERPAIKDFPLQLERLKEFAMDFIKKLSESPLQLSLQSVYLSSALQPAAETTPAVLEQTSSHLHLVPQLHQQPALLSRPYFIKEFITQNINMARSGHQPAINMPAWKRRAVYAASISVITLAAIILGRDFERGVENAYAIQNDLSQYRLAIQNFHNPDEHLAKTLALLNVLQQSVKDTGFKLDLSHLLTFYSYKSQQKARQVYQQALETILVPEIKGYFEEFMRLPVNKNTDTLYAVLKAYLMLGDTAKAQPAFLLTTIQNILPKSLNQNQSASLMYHATQAFNGTLKPQPLNQALISKTRDFLTASPPAQLSYIILKNINNNNIASNINLAVNEQKNPIFVSRQVTNAIPQMFTAKTFSTILSQEIAAAAEEATIGNWVLGSNINPNASQEAVTALIDELRATYINNYIDVWESTLANVTISTPETLVQQDDLIVSLMSRNSPLLQLLHTLHANTYFEPITVASPKLLGMNQLLSSGNQADETLYQIFAGLQNLHQYVKAVLSAENARKAAFQVLSARVLHNNTPDAITQLRIIADKSPEPVKSWLNKVANDTWRLLMQEASSYLNTAWQNEVLQHYQANITSRYPFDSTASDEVDLPKFTAFFGNPGTILSFYNHYLQPLVDTSKNDWQWKSVDSEKLPFSEEGLRQIQHALRIHHAFFPNGDNKLYVQFGLEPHQFSDNIQQVELTINDKKIIDSKGATHNPHVITWPSDNKVKMTSIQMTLDNRKMIGRDFPGSWGWFKLVSQAFDSASSQKQMTLNFAENDASAKYLLFTQKQNNPFLSLNLGHFALPQTLAEHKA